MGVMEYPDEKQPEAREWLDKGWAWLEDHPDDPKANEVFEEWLRVLRKYEETYRRKDPAVDDPGGPVRERETGDDGWAARVRVG